MLMRGSWEFLHFSPEPFPIDFVSHSSALHTVTKKAPENGSIARRSGSMEHLPFFSGECKVKIARNFKTPKKEWAWLGYKTYRHVRIGFNPAAACCSVQISGSSGRKFLKVPSRAQLPCHWLFFFFFCCTPRAQPDTSCRCPCA